MNIKKLLLITTTLLLITTCHPPPPNTPSNPTGVAPIPNTQYPIPLTASPRPLVSPSPTPIHLHLQITNGTHPVESTIRLHWPDTGDDFASGGLIVKAALAGNDQVAVSDFVAQAHAISYFVEARAQASLRGRCQPGREPARRSGARRVGQIA